MKNIKTSAFFIFITIFNLAILQGCSIIPGLSGFRSDDSLANYALAINGGTVSASNYTPTHSPIEAINGIISSEGWDEGGGWECKFERQRPRTGTWSRLDPKTNVDYGSAWLEVQFDGPKTINRVTVYTLNSSKYPAYKYGINEAWLQLWKDHGWSIVGEVSGGAITSRVNLDKQAIVDGKMVFRLDPVKTDKIRFVVFRSNDAEPIPERWTDERRYERSTARVVEIEATGLEKISSSKASVAPRLEPAPEFVLPNLNDEWIRLSNFRGKIVIVTFWAQWSSESKRQVNDLKALHNQFGDEVKIIGISTDEGGKERIEPFVKQSNLNYTILIADTKVKSDYGGVGKLPTTYIIDPEGNIFNKFFSFQGKHILELEIKKLQSRLASS